MNHKHMTKPFWNVTFRNTQHNDTRSARVRAVSAESAAEKIRRVCCYNQIISVTR